MRCHWQVLGLVFMTTLTGQTQADADAAEVTTIVQEKAPPAGQASQPLLTINLALKDGKLYLGELPAQLKGETVLAVDRESLLQLAQPCLNSYTSDLMRSLPAVEWIYRVNLSPAGRLCDRVQHGAANPRL